jgi:exoribonuclease II
MRLVRVQDERDDGGEVGFDVFDLLRRGVRVRLLDNGMRRIFEGRVLRVGYLCEQRAGCLDHGNG